MVIPMPGKHNVLNCMLAIGVAKNLGVTTEEMQRGLTNLQATSMRLQIMEKDGFIIINDCYNASPDSMKSSLDVLNNYKNHRKIAILGTMKELGDESEAAHEEVGKYAKDKVDLLIVLGEYTHCFKKGFEGKDILLFNNMDNLKNELKNIVRNKDIILIKASRGMKFECIVEQLEEISI